MKQKEVENTNMEQTQEVKIPEKNMAFGNHLKSLISRYLNVRHVASLSDIAKNTGVNHLLAKIVLKDLARKGELEIISPASSRKHDPDLEYYRVIRDTDSDYKWETKLMQRASRFPSIVEMCHKEPI